MSVPAMGDGGRYGFKADVVEAVDPVGAAAWIGEILDEPHSRRVLRALLDAVSPSSA